MAIAPSSQGASSFVTVIAVRAAYYTDRGGFFRGENSGNKSARKCGENAELCGSAKQQCFRICNKRGKICHGADSEEYNRRIDAKLYAQVQKVEKASLLNDLYYVELAFREEQFGMYQLGSGEVCKKHSDSDGEQEQWLIFLNYRIIYKYADYNVHYKCFNPEPWIV